MPGQWLTTTVETNKGLSTTATTQQTVNVDLPRGNFLSRVVGKLHIIGVGTPTLTLDRVKVVASGSFTVIDLEGGQLRGINKFSQGSVTNGAAVSTTDLVWLFSVNFGRYFRDEEVILPAKIFKQLQLQLTFTPGATTSVTSVALTLTADEFVSNDDVKSKLIRKVGVVKTTASAANLIERTRLNLGNFLRSIYVHTDDPDNVNANSPVFGGTVAATSPISVLVNNGAERPVSEAMDMLKVKNQETYRFDDADTPDTELSNAAAFTGSEEMICIDFDVLDDLSHILDTSRMNDLTVEFTAAASGTSGDTHIITDEILPVSG
jgi:hypothetical protein